MNRPLVRVDWDLLADAARFRLLARTLFDSPSAARQRTADHIRTMPSKQEYWQGLNEENHDKQDLGDDWGDDSPGSFRSTPGSGGHCD